MVLKIIAILAKSAYPGPTAVNAEIQKRAKCHEDRISPARSSIPRPALTGAINERDRERERERGDGRDRRVREGKRRDGGRVRQDLPRAHLKASVSLLFENLAEASSLDLYETSKSLVWLVLKSGILRKSPPPTWSPKRVIASAVKLKSTPYRSMQISIIIAIRTLPKPPKAMPMELASPGLLGSQNCK